MNKNWQRQTMLDDSFMDMHGIKPEVYYHRENRDEYSIRLVYQGKEIVLTEVMFKGLPKTVTLQCGDNIEAYKCMYDAEVSAVSKFKE